MIRKIYLRIGLFICCCISALSVAAQQLSLAPTAAHDVNTLYFMNNVPIRNSFNPSFQPLSDFYFGLPILGYTGFGIGNNSLTQMDLVYKLSDGRSIYFLNELGDKNKFYNALQPTTLLDANLNLNLLNFGFRKGNSYWTFTINERVDASVSLPKDFMKLGLFGNVSGNDIMASQSFDFKSLGFDMTAYTEAGLGYSIKLGDQWTVGTKLKFLYGNFNASMSSTNLDFVTGVDPWTIKGNSVINYSSPITLPFTNLSSFSTNGIKTVDFLKPSGLGGGIDLGFTYNPIPELTLSAAVTDLGMISWNNHPLNIKGQVDYTFNGIGNLGLNSTTAFQTMTDSVLKALTSSPTLTATSNSYTTYTSPKLNIGVEYGFFDNKLSVGLLSRTVKRNQTYYEELTGSVNGRPFDWLNASASYSVLNGKMSSVGAGLSVRTGVVNWFLAADYVPFYYSSATFGTFKAPVPSNVQGLNFSFGINLVFGNKKDTDHDGVTDKKDKCPETPFSVIVDKQGCPIDADGDGVPDYLDKCPKTPKEAYNHIDQNGCPVDNDSDGVADYRDKCPDTPIGIKVDSVGCPIDSDKDGVTDDKDKCPNTPRGIKVDSVGCPIDTDKDGVFDDKDKCPNTPLGAKVDSVGCPVDTDLDGVPDYMDKCPDTPIAERKMVDKDGCTIKKLESKPVTVAAVKQPEAKKEIKKEIQNLFHKALQGIQFETGKSVIMPISYTILNQIAGVLIANPTYLVEIRGHTDNAGKKDANMQLSINRSKAVMKYLVKHGVAAERMTANGYGDTLPVASNKTAKGKAQNRRVEFIVSFEEITFE